MQTASLRPSRQTGIACPRCVVAIPVKDGGGGLPACLRALADQRDINARRLAPGIFGALIFANNCRDESAELARALTADFPFVARTVERTLPTSSAHAGGARGAAMALAEAWLEEGGAQGGI